MQFTYKARDPLGRSHEGTLEATNREAATQNLRRDGFSVVSLEESAGEMQLFPRPIKKAEIIYTTAQLAIMVDTGIRLSDALDGIAKQEENASLRRLLQDVKGGIESGESFSHVIERYPKHFDKTYVALVKASEQTGSLGAMLDRIAGYLRSQMETRAKVRAALAYPCVMLVLAVAVTIFLLTYILPQFEPLFERQGTKLPTITRVMLTASRAFLDYWAAWLIGGAALAIGGFFFRKMEAGRLTIDWLKLNTPIIGPMVRRIALSRSISTLGTMLQSGVSVLDALQLTAEVSGNYYFEQAWRRVMDEVTNGNRICEALQKEPLFPRTLLQMIAAGEETGQLDSVLAKVSGYYDREVETALKTTTSLIEPLLITVMGFVVGTIGLGLLLPIFSLSRPGG